MFDDYCIRYIIVHIFLVEKGLKTLYLSVWHFFEHLADNN